MAVVEFGYRPDLLTRRLSGVLDHVRWIAALAVCAAHLRNLLLPDYAPGGPLKSVFYFLTLFGTQAVVIFFVVSGLLVGGSIVRGVGRGRFDRSGYAVDRASRLYIVLIPAIVLTEGLRLAGLAVTCPGPEGPDVVIGNLLFLQNFTTVPLCNNHPLWSLSSEAFFYLLGPALLIAAVRRSAAALGFVAVLTGIALAFATASYMTPIFGLGLWLLGLAPWFVRIRLPAWLGVLPFAAMLLLSRSHHAGSEFTEALGLALSFAAFLCCTFDEKAVPLAGPGAWLAAFSYSLYLIHMPIAQAIAARSARPYDPAQPASYLIYFGALGAILAAAWAFGWAFESRTRHVRNWMRRIARLDAPAAAS